METKKSILFVCLGNICRSPACEGICRSACKDLITVDSAGTSRWHRNECPDSRSQDICHRNGIDISGHRARQIRADDWQLFNIIAALDTSVYKTLYEMRPESAKSKIVLFNEPNGIADPYYGGRSEFQRMFKEISDAMPGFLKQHDLLAEIPE